MKLFLVVNGFVNWDKFDTMYDLLIKAFADYGCELVKTTNTDLMDELNKPFPKANFALFWNKDINLAKRMEKSGIRLFNSAHALEYCNDKSLTAVAASHLPRPKTMIAPHTFLPYTKLSFLDKVESTLSYPIIIKECFGSFGNQVWLVKNREELEARVMKITPRPMIFEEYIAESYGRDMRLHIVNGKCVASVIRIAKEGDFRANVTNGGKMYPYIPTEKEKELAIQAAAAVGAEFAGVDLLFGKNGPVLCEVNSNAHFKNLLDATGINVAEYIAEYITEVMRKEH